MDLAIYEKSYEVPSPRFFPVDLSTIRSSLLLFIYVQQFTNNLHLSKFLNAIVCFTMKRLILISHLIMTPLFATAIERDHVYDEEQRKMAYAMQKAVLETEDVSAVQELIKKGFQVCQPIGCGQYTALHGAVQKRNKEMITILIKAGAKPDHQMMLWAFSTYDRELDIPKLLINAGGDTTAYEHPYDTCLYSAVWHGNEPLVQLILSQDKRDIDRAGEQGSPLSLAIRRGHVNLAKKLLSKGADPNKRGHHKNSLSASELLQQRITDLTELKKEIETQVR